MRARIGPVGRDVHLNEIIALQIIIFGGGSSRHSRIRQHDDTTVVRTDAYLVLGTNHTIALYPAQLGLLDGEALVAVIQLAS